MKKATKNAAKAVEPPTRVTRSRAKAFGRSVEVLSPSKASFKTDQKRVIRANSKRAPSDGNEAHMAAIGVLHKKRAILKDVSNVIDRNSSLNCRNATKPQTSRQPRRGPVKSSDEDRSVCTKVPSTQEGAKAELAEDLLEIRMVESQETVPSGNSKQKQTIEKSLSINICKSDVEDSTLLTDIPREAVTSQTEKKESGKIFIKIGESFAAGIVDIDSNTKDPLLCSQFASDMYCNFRVYELDNRPSGCYMEKLQQNITPTMRGILIDWLVEVSEEYKFVPDTLYLTVNTIDRFLSQSHVEKQRLQLLGVACMFIASKYEEICPLGVKEFSFLTDNTCTKEEILKMERQVLSLLRFKLSVPTTKTFLRRFIQAAQASYTVPCVELEFLANYLAELTLIEYSFHKYLPSLIAASVIFLARWTLSQSDHPWNPILEHYTKYMASELKTTVVALEDLQLKAKDCFLKAIHEKYKQEKFKCVATLTSPKPVKSLFQ